MNSEVRHDVLKCVYYMEKCTPHSLLFACWEGMPDIAQQLFGVFPAGSDIVEFVDV